MIKSSIITDAEYTSTVSIRDGTDTKQREIRWDHNLLLYFSIKAHDRTIKASKFDQNSKASLIIFQINFKSCLAATESAVVDQAAPAAAVVREVLNSNSYRIIFVEAKLKVYIIVGSSWMGLSVRLVYSCGKYPDIETSPTTTMIVDGVAPKKMYDDGSDASFVSEGGHGCKCGANCKCDPCNC
ncbi:hypothetical protein R6Q57_008017 [Mikania cordata]